MPRASRGFYTGRGALDAAIAGGSSVIQRIQTGSITIPGGDADGIATATITSVTKANSMLIWNGTNTDLASTVSYARVSVRITLTDATTVTATRENNTTSAVTVYFTVVEFASGVNSIQYDNVVVAATGTSNTQPISAVGANAFVIWLGSSVNPGSIGFGDICTAVELTNSTTVTGNCLAVAGVATTIAFCVVDLNTTIVSGIEQKKFTSVANSATDTSTLTALTMNETMLIYGGRTGVVSGTSTANAWHMVLDSTTNVTFTKASAGAASRTQYYTAVKFAATCLATNKVQRPGTIALAAATSNTRTITSVNTAKAFVNWNGFLATSANADTIVSNIVLTNATTVTAAVTTAGTITAAFEVIEFA